MLTSDAERGGVSGSAAVIVGGYVASMTLVWCGDGGGGDRVGVMKQLSVGVESKQLF